MNRLKWKVFNCNCIDVSKNFAFKSENCPSQCCNRHRRRLKGIHSRSDTNSTGAEGLSFYYPRLLHCLNQMLAVVSLSQHQVLSSKTVRPRTPCGAPCIGHAVSMSVVCSEAPHLQFGEGARPRLCMDEWNRPTPVCRWLSLTQAARGKPIPTGLAPFLGTELGSIFSILCFPFVICPFRSADVKSGKVVQKIPCSWHKWVSGS